MRQRHLRSCDYGHSRACNNGLSASAWTGAVQAIGRKRSCKAVYTLTRPAFMLAPVGRHMFGFAAIMLGVSQFVWHGFATNWFPVPAEFPLHQPLVYLTAGMLALGGLAMFSHRSSRAGLLLIVAVYMFAEVFWARRIIHFPTLFGTWAGFAEQFAPVVGAALCYLSLGTLADAGVVGARIGAERWHWARVAGETLFGLCLISMGIVHLDALEQTADMVPSWLPLGGPVWAVATGIAFLVFGLAIVVRIRGRLAALLATTMLCSFALLVWLPRILAHPERQNSWGGTAITLAVAGGAWMVADTLARRRVVD